MCQRFRHFWFYDESNMQFGPKGATKISMRTYPPCMMSSYLRPAFLLLAALVMYQASECLAAKPVEHDANSAAAALAPRDTTPAANPLPDAPQAQTTTSTTTAPATTTETAAPKQTKRILFIIPNFRSVSADEKLPPTTTKEKFKLTMQDSFDYSAFAEVAILSGMAEAGNSEPQFHKGAAGYARYYWHGFADNTDGNLWVEFIVPTLTREDPRYYTLGHGSVVHRTVYSVSRLFITRDNNGRATPNFSEIVGNGAAAGISGLYYPSAQRGWTKTGQRWFLEVGIDGLSDIVKEFWPDINAKVFHDKY
jgi:hypothetical protein